MTVPGPPVTGKDSRLPALLTATIVSPAIAPEVLVEKPASFVPTSRSVFFQAVVSQAEIVLVVPSLWETTRWPLLVKSSEGLKREPFIAVFVRSVVGAPAI